MKIKLLHLLYPVIAIAFIGCGDDYKWDTNNVSALDGKYETRDKSLDVNEAEQQKIIESMTQRFLYANNGVAGVAITIMKEDKSTINLAYGCAKLKSDVEESGILSYETGDKDNCEEVLTVQNRFKLGSLTKTVVGRTILDIDDDSNYDFSLEDPVTKHLPDDILALGSLSGIKIKHLLFHTSGLNKIDFQPGTVEEVIKKVLARKRLGKPGQYYKYNNAGYIILGEVVKFVTKADSWEGELQKRLNESLGANSFIFPEPANPSWLQTEDNSWLSGVSRTLIDGNQSLTTGYVIGENFTSVLEASGADIAHASGSVIGNILDVNRWMNDLVTNNSGLLSKDYFEKEVMQTHYGDDYISHLTWNMGPGLGFEQNENAFFHLGAIVGYSCMSLYSKNEKVTITTCLNGSGSLIHFPYEVLNEIYPYRKAYIPTASAH